MWESPDLSGLNQRNAGVVGKAVTPFVLQRVNELTGGKSLETSIRHNHYYSLVNIASRNCGPHVVSV